MSVRTYNPSVRVGNWSEDIQLEEDHLKDFLEKKEKGQLLIQQSQNLTAVLQEPKNLSISRDGCIHYGDVVMLTCLEAADRTKYSSGVDPRDECVVSINVSDPMKLIEGLGNSCIATGSKNTSPTIRSALVIKSIGLAEYGQVLRYGEPFALSTLDEAGSLFLASDRKSFEKSAKKSRHQEVSFTSEQSILTQWQVRYHDPRLRMEYEQTPVPANHKVVISHIKTNQNLAVEQAFPLRTPLGKDYEISCHTYLDSHKAEEDVNHWIIKVSVPGDDIYPSSATTSKSTPASSAQSGRQSCSKSQ